MSNFGIICPPLTGHLNPFFTLGRALQSRGHRVTVFQVPSLESLVKEEGLEFCPIGPTTDNLSSVIDELGQKQGLASLRFAVDGACRSMKLVCTYAPDAIAAKGIEMLLVDQNEPAGWTVAQHLELPFVNICPSLPLNRELAIPPTYMGWDYSPNLGAKFRNFLGYMASNVLIWPINNTVNRFRRKWALKPIYTPDESFSTLAQICQMPHEFDFPRENLPAGFHYVGPFFDQRTLDPYLRSEVSFPFERLDERPLVYASLGTLQSQANDYFQRIAQACSTLKVQLVIANPSSANRNETFAGDPIVVSYAPQMALLRRTSVTITHAGMNTVMQSLMCGVPMVAMPITHDQPAIAARLARTEAGIVVTPKQASVEHFRSSIQSVLADRKYRNAALLLKDAIARSGGVERAADIVEQSLKKGIVKHSPRTS